MTPITIDCVVDQPRYLPARAHPADAGADLKARLGSISVTIESGKQAMIPTGVKVAIPVGWVGFVTPRSGLANKLSVSIRNSPGTIDATYRGELMIILVNGGSESVTIHDGDRIAQLVVLPCWVGEFDPVNSLDDTPRGTGGFGSTG